jgi:hypothetical protein
MHVIDLLTTKDKWAHDLYDCEIDNIKNDNVRLKKNYINIQLQDYHCFTILVTDDRELVAFSGLQRSGPWNQQVGRISTRFRIAKKFQTTGMLSRTYDRSIFSGSGYLMPYQVTKAIELGLSGVFFSRENTTQRRHLQSIADRCNEFETRIKYEVLASVANICKRIDGRINNQYSCWQNIVYAKISDPFDLGLPLTDPENVLLTNSDDTY